MAGFNGIMWTKSGAPHTTLTIVAPIWHGILLPHYFNRSNTTIINTQSAGITISIGKKQFC
jgi:hypothetical protein